MKVLIIMFLIGLWVIGLVEGDCSAAALFTLFGCCAIIDDVLSKRGRKNGGRKII